MKTAKTIRVKNDLPHLLEAVCSHPECPDWLMEGIWDAFNSQSLSVIYTATYWAAEFEAMREHDAVEPDVDVEMGLPLRLVSDQQQ